MSENGEPVEQPPPADPKSEEAADDSGNPEEPIQQQHSPANNDDNDDSSPNGEEAEETETSEMGEEEREAEQREFEAGVVRAQCGVRQWLARRRKKERVALDALVSEAYELEENEAHVVFNRREATTLIQRAARGAQMRWLLAGWVASELPAEGVRFIPDVPSIISIWDLHLADGGNRRTISVQANSEEDALALVRARTMSRRRLRRGTSFFDIQKQARPKLDVMWTQTDRRARQNNPGGIDAITRERRSTKALLEGNFSPSRMGSNVSSPTSAASPTAGGMANNQKVQMPLALMPAPAPSKSPGGFDPKVNDSLSSRRPLPRSKLPPVEVNMEKLYAASQRDLSTLPISELEELCRGAQVSQQQRTAEDAHRRLVTMGLLSRSALSPAQRREKRGYKKRDMDEAASPLARKLSSVHGMKRLNSSASAGSATTPRKVPVNRMKLALTVLNDEENTRHTIENAWEEGVARLQFQQRVAAKRVGQKPSVASADPQL